MTSINLRKTLVFIHKWLGINTLIFFALIVGSGTLLVVSDEIEAVFHPKIWAAPAVDTDAASFGDIYESISTTYPQSTLYVLQRQPQIWLADRSYATTAWGEKIVIWTDPVTAEIRDVTADRNFHLILKDFHDSLFVPRRIGFILVSSTSVILLISVLTGLLTYRRFWKSFFRLPTRNGGALQNHVTMHRFVGLWTSVFLIIIALTGLLYTANGLGMNGFIPSVPAASKRNDARPAWLNGALLSQAETVAKQSVAGFSPDSMVMPFRATDGIRFSGSSDAAGNQRGATTVSVDPSDMQVLATLLPDDNLGLAKIKPLANALHFGEWAGNFSRLVWLISGAVSVYLMYVGAKMYVVKTAANDSHAPVGQIRLFMRGMGIFKWAYLGLVVAILGLSVIQFGPGSMKWVTLSPTSANATGLKAQILGNLRVGGSAKYRIVTNTDQIASITLGTDSEPQVFDPSQKRSVFEFLRPVRADANVLSVMLADKTGNIDTVIYDLGKPIW